VFYGFGQAKFDYGGSILDSSQITPLSQLPPKTMLSFKVLQNWKISVKALLK